MILYKIGSTQLCPSEGATLPLSDGTTLTCPPAELTCSRDTQFTLLTSSSNISPSCKYNYVYDFVNTKSNSSQGVTNPVPLVQGLPVQHIV